MKRFIAAIRNFFLPPADARTFTRVVPLIVVAMLMIVLFAASNYAWEESNSVSFCGLTCHTMPPEYVTHQHSAHTNVTCEDCHMGRDRLAVMIPRKIRYSWQTGTAMLLNNYEFPIVAKNMAPAREACENCHKPDVFTSDKLVEIKHFADDEANTATSTFLSIKTGGGSRRQGLGFGIHWHVENPVYFYATDARSQDIPYIVVEQEDGTRVEYFDVEADFDPGSIQQEDLQQMDCITCHNRTAHLVDSPNATLDELMTRGLVSSEIPEIKKKSVEILSVDYASVEEALNSIASLKNYYQQQHSDFLASNGDLVDQAVASIQEAYQRTHFPEQEVGWVTHPNNLAHMESPGCFRCHDGKHLTATNEAVRLECNLCHSIPVVSAPNQLTARLELSKGFEPESHKDPSWINLHRTVFDETCQGCHTVEDPGGVSDTSFCSNSACHGANWEFAGFDAPKLREIMAQQAKAYATSTPSVDQANKTPTVSEQEATPDPQAAEGPVTFEGQIAKLMKDSCGSCHGPAAMKGLNVTTYAGLMKGGESGDAVVPGDPENSLLVQVQSGPQKHFGQFNAGELAMIEQWILEGAAEK